MPSPPMTATRWLAVGLMAAPLLGVPYVWSFLVPPCIYSGPGRFRVPTPLPGPGPGPVIFRPGPENEKPPTMWTVVRRTPAGVRLFDNDDAGGRGRGHRPTSLPHADQDVNLPP